MKKLKLDLDQIQVVSFAAETAGRDRGTVNALSYGDPTPVFACGESGRESCYSCFPHYCPRMPASRDVC